MPNSGLKLQNIKFEQPSTLLLFFDRYINYIVAIIIVLILIIGYAFLFVPKINTIKQIKEDNSTTQSKKEENEAILARIADLEEDYNRIKIERSESLDDLKKFIPDDPQIAELFVMIDKIAVDNDFQLSNISISEEEDDGTDSIKKARINITVANVVPEVEEEGTPEDGDGQIALDDIPDQGLEVEDVPSPYEMFKQFLTALENNLRLTDIDSVSFGALPVPEEGGSPIMANFTLSLTTYYK